MTRDKATRTTRPRPCDILKELGALDGDRKAEQNGNSADRRVRVVLRHRRR